MINEKIKNGHFHNASCVFYLNILTFKKDKLTSIRFNKAQHVRFIRLQFDI